ncbi:hypothetical protein K469DRAFT_357538 [Zopfia rhizophila CBS 207.26]|uniref:Uncharacterized protein n=1 Tax=Zopfia rhizophila CBS 207.26 TaxID=1314779 RepID=A0A6A6DDR7_9PEZI|nr:hypothetical protein K469DRAFT_357538 [Zopfia rhizophila CBS 207.26]
MRLTNLSRIISLPFLLLYIVLFLMAAATYKHGQRDTSKQGTAPQAPLHFADHPARISGWYRVELQPGYLMEQHSIAVGTNMNTYLREILDRRRYPDRIIYTCKDVGDELLDAIRKDPKVQAVTCDLRDGYME